MEDVSNIPSIAGRYLFVWKRAWLMVYWPENEASWAIDHQSRFQARQQSCLFTSHRCHWLFFRLLFADFLQTFGLLLRRNVCLYPETVLRSRPKFWLTKVYEEESLFKNLEIFWMNNIKKLSNEVWNMMWRIMQISEDVIHLGRGECPGVDDILLDLQKTSHHT